jgi:hypothetical protein
LPNGQKFAQSGHPDRELIRRRFQKFDSAVEVTAEFMRLAPGYVTAHLGVKHSTRVTKRETELRRLFIPLQDFDASRFRCFKISMLQDFDASRFRNLKISMLQDFDASRLRGFKT